jgi:hypothetical protein
MDDGQKLYGLTLWHDAIGFFGEFSSPILEADSPTSRLYDTQYTAATRTLTFRAKFADGERYVSGVISDIGFVGSVRVGSSREPLVLKRVKEVFGGNGYVSRAQFDCAMDLYRRY